MYFKSGPFKFAWISVDGTIYPPPSPALINKWDLITEVEKEVCSQEERVARIHETVANLQQAIHSSEVGLGNLKYMY